MSHLFFHAPMRCPTHFLCFKFFMLKVFYDSKGVFSAFGKCGVPQGLPETTMPRSGKGAMQTFDARCGGADGRFPDPVQVPGGSGGASH